MSEPAVIPVHEPGASCVYCNWARSRSLHFLLMASANWSRLALWLEPTTTDAEHVQEIMAHVRTWVPSPRLEPHMTLLSGLTRGGTLTTSQVEQTWEQVVSSARRWRLEHLQYDMSVSLLGPTSKGTYYQSLVLPLGPEQGLADLHVSVRDALALPTREFWPHISLAYTDLGPQAEALAFRLNQDGWRSAFLPDGRLTFSILSLWSCAGPTEEWQKLHEVPLSDL